MSEWNWADPPGYFVSLVTLAVGAMIQGAWKILDRGYEKQRAADQHERDLEKQRLQHEQELGKMRAERIARDRDKVREQVHATWSVCTHAWRLTQSGVDAGVADDHREGRRHVAYLDAAKEKWVELNSLLDGNAGFYLPEDLRECCHALGALGWGLLSQRGRTMDSAVWSEESPPLIERMKSLTKSFQVADLAGGETSPAATERDLRDELVR